MRDALRLVQLLPDPGGLPARGMAATSKDPADRSGLSRVGLLLLCCAVVSGLTLLLVPKEGAAAAGAPAATPAAGASPVTAVALALVLPAAVVRAVVIPATPVVVVFVRLLVQLASTVLGFRHPPPAWVSCDGPGLNDAAASSAPEDGAPEEGCEGPLVPPCLEPDLLRGSRAAAMVCIILCRPVTSPDGSGGMSKVGGRGASSGRVSIWDMGGE